MELWKFGGNELKKHILELFNKIIEKNQMPQEWETGLVTNIHKKGTKSKCENYRGITLLHSARPPPNHRAHQNCQDHLRTQHTPINPIRDTGMTTGHNNTNNNKSQKGQSNRKPPRQQ